jgi:nitrogen regulatory protein P-II 1
MAKLVILITTHIDQGLAVAEAWEAAGASGVTLIESHGLRRLREQGKTLEIPLFVSMTQLMRRVEETNQTLLTVVDDDAMVDKLIDAASEVLGDLCEPNTGIAFVLDVERTFGVRPCRSEDEAEAES